MNRIPIVGITAGDPAGVGYEITLRVIADPATHEQVRPVVYGSASAIRRDLGWLGLELEVRPTEAGPYPEAGPGVVLVHDIDPNDEAAQVTIGEVSAAAGEIAVRSVRAAVTDALDGRIDAICTAPLNKESMWRAGHEYDGHTGLLAEQCDNAEVSMLLVGDRLRVAHVTTHLAFGKVPERITRDRVAAVIGIAGRTLQGLGFDTPRIAVAGLNPHAGEHGLFGDEEQTAIGPAIELAREQGWQVSGPESPDAVFGAAINGRFDVVIAMYHDQGHIPVKLIEFDRAVNISGGLPIVRTSVDHGTAFDIAGQGIARTENLEVALELAGRLGMAHHANRVANGRN